ncbi:M48 family metallopeptidase [soil metagenome]
MSVRVAVTVLLAVALGSAGALALASRAPASVRSDEPGPRAQDPSLGARFDDDQVARAAAYNGPAYLGFALGAALNITVLAVLARGPWARLVERAETWPGGWVARTALLAAAIVVISTIVSLPLSYVRGFAMEHAWQLSTQDLGGWLSDKVRSLIVGVVMAAVTAIAFFGLVRWQPRAWWLWGWAVFTGLTALFVFLWPVVVAPLFNTFTPLRDASLKARVTALAHDAGVGINEVLVADASRRSTAENAYVAGLGGTRRLVLYDTLLEAGGEDATLYVVGHELGHQAENHVLKGVLLSSAGLLAGFGVLAWLGARTAPWSWAGADGVGDLRALPLLLLFATVAGLISLPVENAVSRRFEARADEWAIELTHDPSTATRALRRLALTNLADLRPPSLAVALLYTHPSIPDRIRAVNAAANRAP